MTDDNMMVRDNYGRALEVLRDLSKDGYPSDAQWTILCMAICEVIAKDADDEDHLHEGVEITKDAVDGGSKFAFERRAAQR
jgi:hypothetical protein